MESMFKFKNKILTFVFIAFVLSIGQAQATLTIEISEGYEDALPIAVIPFQVDGPGTMPEDISAIVSHNLRRSGRFAPLADNALPSRPSRVENIVFDQWRSNDIDHLIMGSVTSRPDGLHDIEMRLVDVLRRKQIIGKRWRAVPSQQLRQVAHQMSDEIYLELTGIPGAFNTRLAYVTMMVRGDERHYTLEVSDSDGHNPQPLLRSKMPIMSPSWSPDGSQLAYVSFESGRSNVIVQNLDGSNREVLANFSGINSAPSWSPDGKSLAMTLSKDGNADIFIMNMQTRALRKVTRHWAIETEAAWSIDGKEIYFSSDRRGQPQIFKMNLDSGEVTRISFQGNYNANPEISPNGRYLAMVHANNGFNIGLMDLYTNEFNIVTNAFLGESPSFAPNSDMLVYAMNRDNRGQLAVVSVDGRASQILSVKNGQVREPAWGPYRVQPSQ